MGRRLAVAEAERHVVATWLVHACSSGRVGTLIDCALHLLQDLVNLKEVALGAKVGHRWQGIVLSIGAMGRTINGNNSRRGHVLGSERSTVDGKSTVQGHQSLANLGVRCGIKLTALSVTKKFIKSIIGSLAALVEAGLVTEITTASESLVVHRAPERSRGAVVLVVAARMAILVRLTIGGRISTDLAIVIIIARRSFRLMCPISRIHSALVRRPDQHRIVGMRLDVLLEILRSLE